VAEPRQNIKDLADGKARAFVGTINPTTGTYLDDVYAQNKSLSEHVAADYHGRFLIELIQNGNDAHERGQTNGEIEVLFAPEEGSFGTLYVANRGRPFSLPNVVALVSIGMSSKPPGESIGNKGLGFRSVSHVCDAPEIYSQLAAPAKKQEFDGYRFTFATGQHIDKLFPDKLVRKLARRDLPIFFVPLWLDGQPRRVGSFARHGFASVVRLPLRDQAAADATREEIVSLHNQSSPMLLFMERLRRLAVTVEGPDEETASSTILDRTEKHPADWPDFLSLVDLRAAGRFLVSKGTVGEDAMKQKIASGVETRQLHSSWNGWTGEGEIALAVRVDEGPVTPRLYTHLPMGEGAQAPFQGYLHGSFFPTSNRKAIDSGVALNRLLLQEAAALAAKSVLWLASNEASRSRAPFIDAQATARAAVDLLVWNKVSSLEPDEVKEAARSLEAQLDLPRALIGAISKEHGGHFTEVAIIPCVDIPTENLGEGIGWRTPKKARYWSSESEIFTTAVVAEHSRALGIAPIWLGLGDARVKRLLTFLRTQATGPFTERLTPAERAEIATSLAASMPKGRRALSGRWTAFYRDLVGFMENSARPLAGRAIVLCSDGTLRAGGTPATTEERQGLRPRRRLRRGESIEKSLFFPPAPRGAGDDDATVVDRLKVPMLLEEFFAFAADGLPWHGEIRACREFLEQGLVSAYDAETVLTRISHVVNSGPNAEKVLAGLRWAFTIWRRARESGRPISIQRQHRLLVPTAEQDLIPASEAIFSETWPEETLGRKVHQFLGAAPPGISDLDELRKRQLAPTSHRAFSNARGALWTQFLTELGVRRGLIAVEKLSEGQFRANELTSFSFCQRLGIPKTVADVWAKEINGNAVSGTTFKYSNNYSFKGKLWWLPGQADQETFSNTCRELYASLIVEWLAQAPEEVFSVFVQHLHYSDGRMWPTPLAAFLRAAKWMPADDQTPDGPVRAHFKPCDVWIAGYSGDRFPYYLRQPASAVAKVIERSSHPILERLTARAELRMLNSKATLIQQACFLAEQFERRSISRHYEPQFANLYASTWRAIADRYEVDAAAFAKIVELPDLVARRGGELALVKPGKPGQPNVFVRDIDDEIAPGLIAVVNGLMFDAKGTDRSRIGRVMESLYGDNIRLVSQVDYTVRADGLLIDELPRDPSALVVCPWLRSMVAVATEELKGTEASRLPTDRSVIFARLERVGLNFVSRLAFEFDGKELVPSDNNRAYVFRRTDGSPVVVASHQGAVTWPLVESCLPAICEAIELPSIANGMRLLVRELMAWNSEVSEATPDAADIDRLSKALFLDETAMAAARYLLSERLDTRLPWIRAAVHMVGGPEALDSFRAAEISSGGDPLELSTALAELLALGTLTANELIEVSRQSFSVDQFRERLDLDFAAFNASLAATGGTLDTYPELHASQVLNFVIENEISIIDALRNAVAPILTGFAPAPDYATSKDEIRKIPADSAWLPVHRSVPDDLITDQVAKWLEAKGAHPLGSNEYELEPVSKVRSVNSTAVAKFSALAAPIVRTWCVARGLLAHAMWLNSLTAEAGLRSALEAAGVVDFRRLDDATILRWCGVLKLWPDGMKPTVDREALGIKVTDIEAETKKALEEAERVAVKARSVLFNGRDVDPVGANWTLISSEIEKNLSKQIKTATLGRLADLAPVDPGTSNQWNRPGPGRRSGPHTSQIPQPKKDMIGRLGELVVYHWLKERLPTQDIDKAWVSENGFRQLGKQGTDSAGFDFEVEYRRQTWQIEVKASLGDHQRFEMGETEVRAARDAAKPRSTIRYCIIYVADPHDPPNTHIDVLPNPMSAEADGVLDLLGEGVRFGFKRR
jgi:hypothetical protein